MAVKRSPSTSKPSLLPTPRRPSLNNPDPSSPTHAPSGFRALRSLLPFGPSKQTTPLSSPSATANNSSRFASFSMTRRSIQRERSFSASHPGLPVMVIDATAEEIPLRKSVSLQDEPVQFPVAPKTSPERIKSNPERFEGEDSSAVSLAQRTPSPNPELSTIIEADTSGISKHLPSASPSPSPSPISSPSPPSLPQRSLSVDDTSALDLSTSQLEAQVKDAILAQASQSAAAHKWLEAGAEASPEPGDVSFNLGALDPELAALLSPNRIPTSDASRKQSPAGETASLRPAGLTPQHQSSRPRLRPIQRPTPVSESIKRSVSPSTTNSTAVSRPSASPLTLSQPPSPMRPASPATSSSHVASSTPAIRRIQHAPSASTSTPHITARRPILGRMLQPSSWESPRNEPNGPSFTRGSLDIPRTRPPIDATRRSADYERTTRPRTRSMSVDEHVSPATSRDVSPQPNTSRFGTSSRLGNNRTEWLGPRTAKAFRAAGLLGPSDSNDAESSDGVSRFGSVRSPSSMGRPDSRMATSPSSMGRRRRGSGSGSYFGGSQLMESPTLTLSSRDTPRSASTAPTSVSGASWERDRDEIRELKDKHAVETGALLSALSDSQRTTKVLREENTELRQRIAQLEVDVARLMMMERENGALREFVTELREEAGQLKLQLRLAAPAPVGLPVASTSRLPHPLRMVQDEIEPSNSFQSSVASRSKSKRRLSSSSSNFAVPPSNMSLLLNEDGANSSDFDERSVSLLASPTMVFGRVMPVESSPTPVHRANRSITSVATTEPNTSLGSPRSLQLRPCDEDHLDDLEHDDEDWP
ncbi:DUF2012 domain-containing protein [Mycena chlorophos]|uniref:DUF2012 domain-containing protein n=1 Tax=Mycena chlorophos TaxID=658473 RepID=A0A8H6WFM3_MYCCL|nr:DUF2012 domain-containing protein [Mycena chlorophos]